MDDITDTYEYHDHDRSSPDNQSEGSDHHPGKDEPHDTIAISVQQVMKKKNKERSSFNNV